MTIFLVAEEWKLEKLFLFFFFPFFSPFFFDDLEVTTYHPIHLQQHWLSFQSWKNYVYEIHDHFCNNELYKLLYVSLYKI